jgi:hypothetical protein
VSTAVCRADEFRDKGSDMVTKSQLETLWVQGEAFVDYDKSDPAYRFLRAMSRGATKDEAWLVANN